MERPIEATTTLHVAYARAREVLIDSPGSVLCEESSGDQRRRRRFTTELAVPVGKAGTSVHHKVEVVLGAPRPGGSFAVPLSWKAAGHESLYPTFEGELEAADDREGTRLTLAGTYHVPLGAVGRVGDRVAGRKLAHSSLVSFVEAIARRLDDEVCRRTGERLPRAARYQVRVRDEVGSENYLG